MSDQKPAATPDQKPAATPDQKPAVATEPETTSATHAGRLQAGESVTGLATTRSPRGVAEPAADARAEHEGIADLQEHVTSVIEKESEQGFRGVKTDPTPNENYTVGGVTRGLPTPETTVVTPAGH